MSVKNEIIKICNDYFETYLKERNFEKLLQFLSQDFKGIGTGEDEFSKDSYNSMRLFKRDIEQAPSEVRYKFQEFEVDVVSSLSAIVFCIVDFETELFGHEVKLGDLRMSILFSRESEADTFKIRHQHVSFPAKEQGVDESYPLKQMEERNRILEIMVNEKTKELEKLLEQTMLLAITDKLTGLYNRLEIDKRLDEAIAGFKRYGTAFSVLIVDVDNFKRVNDLYGHQKGDWCLQKTAEILKERMRKTDVLGRWGGEEFIVICPNTHLAESVLLGESIRKAIEEESFDIDGNYTVSIGISSVQKDDEANCIIKRADENLYLAKSKGRNRVEPSFSPVTN